MEDRAGGDNVWRPQAAHSKVNGLEFSVQAFAPWHFGQMKPFGHRFSKRWRAQAASSGNRAAKAVRDMGGRVSNGSA